MALKRGEIKPPRLPKEAVEVASLGGEVIVRALTLTERLALGRNDGAREAIPVALLAQCVVDETGLPLFARDEWEAFGAAHIDDAMRLVAVAMRLSGLDGDDAKNG